MRHPFNHLIAIMLIFVVGVAPGAAKSAVDEQAILETIDAFFIALAAGDADTIEALQSPNSITIVARPETDQPIQYGVGADLVSGIRAGSFPKVVEPYWSPTVLQRKSLAVVWTPYEVRVDDELIHCGVDVFNLSRHDDGWKIDAVSWTAEPSACEELWPDDKSVLRPQFPKESHP